MKYVEYATPVIEAVRFIGFHKTNGTVIFTERPEWLVREFGNTIHFFDKPDTLTIDTLVGKKTVEPGDYVVKGIKGNIFPTDPTFFEETYKEVTR